MRPDQAATIVAALTGAYPEARVLRETVELYATFLLDLDADVAARAVTRWIARQPRFPRISELRDAVDRENGGAPPDIDQAWNEVNAEIRRVGHYGAPRFTHEAIALAVQAVGWNQLCLTDEPGVERAHFAKAYESTKKRTADASHGELVELVAPKLRALMDAPASMADVSRQLGQVEKRLDALAEPKRVKGRR